ncbi:MAG: LysR substrate-binding domain-containing protein [Verrucomicrobiales bacterium]|nr:LysR substrate-binding domain-containing protein [Verrucomicrobiales bacterium]
MELRHLRYFVAVAEAENVTRAALKLHVSQPALSRQIHDLEDEIGFPLLERSAKSVRLTAAGRFFLNEARAVLQRAGDAVKAARAVAGGTRGEIHVGYAPSITVQILPPTLRIFQAEFPGVKVALHDLSTEEMLTQLRVGKLDVALVVRLREKELRGLRFEELARYPMCVAVAPGHPLARLRKVKLAAIADEPLIGYERENYPEYHERLEKLYGEFGRKPPVAEEHEGVSSLIAAVEAGRGIALVPDCLACMVGPRLKLIPLVPAGPPVIVGAAVCKGPVPITVEKFIAAARPKPRKP